MIEQNTIPFIEIDDLLMQHEINSFKYCKLPQQLVWTNQKQAVNSLMFLAEQFTKYFDQIMQTTPEAVDQFDCPIEIVPYYTSISVEVESVITMIGKSMYGQSRIPTFILDRTGTIKFNETGNLLTLPDESQQHVIFKWAVRNRYLDQIPLSKMGSYEIIEVRKATPRLIKQILNLYREYEDRCESYPLTNAMGVKISPIKTKGLDYFDNMSFVYMNANIQNDLDFLISSYGKRLIRILTMSAHHKNWNKYRYQTEKYYQFALRNVLSSGFFFELLPGKHETTIPFIEV